MNWVFCSDGWVQWRCGWARPVVKIETEAVGGDKLEHFIFRGILSSKVPKGIAFAKRYFFQWKNAFWQKRRHEIKINYKVKKVASFYIIIIRQEKGDSLVTWGRTKDGKNRRKSFSYKNKLQHSSLH